MTYKILIVDDEPFTIELMLTILEGQEYEMLTASNGEEALEKIEQFRPRLVVLDYMMPLVSGGEVLRSLGTKYPETFVVMVTGRGSEQVAVETMKLGALDYIRKPFRSDEFRKTIRQLLRRTDVLIAEQAKQKRLLEENQLLHAQLAKGRDFEIIGTSESMKAVFVKVDRIACEDVTVLIRGESGTGKELVARTIHARSSRSEKAMLTVNCAALADNLIESELFGHERGAFTGAITHRIGKFELADGGTLFLDEIGDMSLITQAKVLRVLQERTFERVGGVSTLKTDIRIITATHRNLEQMVRDGTFREDLFYRINVHPIQLPPLRQRQSDILLLFQYFIDKFCHDFSRSPRTCSSELASVLRSYAWPGNVRELRNIAERIVMLSDGQELDLSLLPETIAGVPIEPERSSDRDVTLKEYVNQAKEAAVQRALDKYGWNRTRAAKALDISVRHMQNMIKEFALEPPESAD